MLTPQFAAIAPIFNPMSAFCMLFADNRHHAGKSDSSGIITCRQKGSVSSILCAARFRAGVLRNAVLSFVLAQDRYKSVLSNASSGQLSPLSILADPVIGQ
jgi:hypothetical protein